MPWQVKTFVFQTAYNPLRSSPPGIYTPCVTYSYSVTIASCDCQLSEYQHYIQNINILGVFSPLSKPILDQDLVNDFGARSFMTS